jgi:hypothetical protein
MLVISYIKLRMIENNKINRRKTANWYFLQNVVAFFVKGFIFVFFQYWLYDIVFIWFYRLTYGFVVCRSFFLFSYIRLATNLLCSLTYVLANNDIKVCYKAKRMQYDWLRQMKDAEGHWGSTPWLIWFVLKQPLKLRFNVSCKWEFYFRILS